MGKAYESAIAHVRSLEDGTRLPPHDLESHLKAVAARARTFAESFGNGDWAALAGLWHDLGKYKPAFQRYIREQGDYENLEADTSSSTDKQHAIVGTLHAVERFGEEGGLYARVFAYLIAGHHTGLPDWGLNPAVGGALQPRLSAKEHLADALQGSPPEAILNAELPDTTFAGGPEHLHLWIRMLFSCLIDADFLDTEHYMNLGQSENRAVALPELPALKARFDESMARFVAASAGTAAGEVYRLRQEILAQCRQHATWQPGVFSLSVPTGGGKTLSGMAFALEHAVKYHKSRIIVAIPYTSIIEQTAKQYREIFGDEAVLEHHSNLDPSRDTTRSRLASENWDAPIVVTTNVQLFESLFAARTSSCRKLHNIANSVIILDEAQMLPPGYLDPIVSTMKGLCQLFGCSIVLSTATQPTLDGRFQSGKAVFHGFEPGTVRELMSDPRGLSDRLRRVEILLFRGALERVAWPEIAEALGTESQVLCIVNTRRDCRELFDLMPEGTVHLSALMCPEHRSQVIARIKLSLKRGEPIRVVSTQLVEAGVDFDFPVVYRAMAGFDSIAQAAGRCNREGRLNLQGKLGRTVVFLPPQDAPAGLLRKGQDAGAEVLRVYPELAANLVPEVFSRYFTLFYSRVNSFDEKGIHSLLAGADAQEAKIQFRTAATQFTLIENTGQVSVIVWYDPGVRSLVERLELTGPYRDLMRRLQRHTVTIPERVARDLEGRGYLRSVVGMEGFYTQVEIIAQSQEINIYDPDFGLRLEGPQLAGLDHIA